MDFDEELNLCITKGKTMDPSFGEASSTTEILIIDLNLISHSTLLHLLIHWWVSLLLSIQPFNINNSSTSDSKARIK
ncbi:unnamed protein product [Brassica oleracea var. botrytis]